MPHLLFLALEPRLWILAGEEQLLPEEASIQPNFSSSMLSQNKNSMNIGRSPREATFPRILRLNPLYQSVYVTF